MLADISVALKSIISQRLVKKQDGSRTPAVEVLLNSRYVAELIEKGDLTEIKDAMEKSMVPGSQTFEQCLFALYKANVITLDEALANADSANNLQWLINNAAPAIDVASVSKVDDPVSSLAPGTSFSGFTLKMDTDS